MDNEKQCKYCNKIFNNVVGRVFSNHVRWCKKNPQRQESIKNLTPAILKYYDSTLGAVEDFQVSCFICNKTFTVQERKSKFPTRDKYFCSRRCANTRCLSQEIKDKIRNTINNNIFSGKIKTKPKVFRKCLYCQNEFDSSRKKLYCSKECVRQSRKPEDEFIYYRNKCKFTFNVWDYPKEFNLNLIREHGWYQAANRGNNLYGVSRDHKISVKFGWINGIPTEFLSHPANCELMQHSDNSSKNEKCSITLKELKESIEKWNKLYASQASE